jgi:hypothetical protein
VVVEFFGGSSSTPQGKATLDESVAKSKGFDSLLIKFQKFYKNLLVKQMLF